MLAEIVLPYIKELVSVFGALLIFGLERFSRSRVRLQWGAPYQFSFLLPPQPPQVPVAPQVDQPQQPQAQAPAPPPQGGFLDTKGIWVKNTGDTAATDVEVLLNSSPLVHNLWPPLQHEALVLPDARLCIKVAYLAPGEGFGVFMIGTPPQPIPGILSIRSRECVGYYVEAEVRDKETPGQRKIRKLLSFLGLGAAIYLSILLVQFVANSPGLK